jgi:alpha-tubulin suppressor-like RCC1 family protein
LTSDNEVYSWGSSKRGVLGYKSDEDVVIPRKVDFFEGKKVVKIESGAEFNVAMTEVL